MGAGKQQQAGKRGGQSGWAGDHGLLFLWPRATFSVRRQKPRESDGITAFG
jgi:hypothetical protein